MPLLSQNGVRVASHNTFCSSFILYHKKYPDCLYEGTFYLLLLFTAVAFKFTASKTHSGRQLFEHLDSQSLLLKDLILCSQEKLRNLYARQARVILMVLGVYREQ